MAPYRHFADAAALLAGIATAGVLNARVAELAPPALAADQTLACWCLVHGLASLAVDGRLPPQADTPEALAARLTALGIGAQSG